jgi:hypothetical protein
MKVELKFNEKNRKYEGFIAGRIVTRKSSVKKVAKTLLAKGAKFIESDPKFRKGIEEAKVAA